MMGETKDAGFHCDKGIYSKLIFGNGQIAWINRLIWDWVIIILLRYGYEDVVDFRHFNVEFMSE